LITGALAGCEADLEVLFHRHWPRAYRAAFLIVHDHAAAEDIAQEAFLAAVRRLDRFDRRRPFGPWLSAIVANRAIDWVRARASRRETGHEPVASAAAPASRSRAYSEEVLAALATLAPEHRAVVVLRYVLEYTPGEIARALELPVIVLDGFCSRRKLNLIHPESANAECLSNALVIRTRGRMRAWRWV